MTNPAPPRTTAIFTLMALRNPLALTSGAMIPTEIGTKRLHLSCGTEMEISKHQKTNDKVERHDLKECGVDEEHDECICRM